MDNLEYLKELFSILRENGCVSFKNGGLEIGLGSPPVPSLVSGPSPAEELMKAEKKIEEAIPPDLRADDLFNYDKVLNWSGSGETEPMPLTGEEG